MTLRAPTEKIPEHLLPFIAKQDTSLYTSIDHASWRYIMRVSRAYFKKHAHQKYLAGLKETGISTERIPLIEDMDRCLRRFGWRAVAVSGFIPPAVFMEFQSLGILPIACEMRTIEHLAYTPAPDIVHEAAGHAPIVADPEYAEYLRQYGEVSRKAIFSWQDMALYEAIRTLSDVKEDPQSTPKQIADCETKLQEAVDKFTYVSEATCLARMNWWTVEYGLVGKKDPKIYGAGLLSSVGESYHCLGPKVKKLPLTLDCIKMSYDITRPQPQLFVTPDFSALTKVLEQFAKTMAYKKGGAFGVQKAKEAGTVTTTLLDTGVQISGILADFVTDAKGNPVFLKFQGPTQLAFSDHQIQGQGPDYHSQGFSAPIGKVQGKSPTDLTDTELKSGKLQFDSGIELEGKLKNKIQHGSKNQVLVFEPCMIKSASGETLYKPEWGPFDLACGVSVTSVFGGAADRGAYLKATGGFGQKPRAPKTNLTRANEELANLYGQIRTLREKGRATLEALTEVLAVLDKKFPDDWLLRLELLELNARMDFQSPWEKKVRAQLQAIAKTAQDKDEMIKRGLEILTYDQSTDPEFQPDQGVKKHA